MKLISESKYPVDQELVKLYFETVNAPATIYGSYFKTLSNNMNLTNAMMMIDTASDDDLRFNSDKYIKVLLDITKHALEPAASNEARGNAVMKDGINFAHLNYIFYCLTDTESNSSLKARSVLFRQYSKFKKHAANTTEAELKAIDLLAKGFEKTVQIRRFMRVSRFPTANETEAYESKAAHNKYIRESKFDLIDLDTKLAIPDHGGYKLHQVESQIRYLLINQSGANYSAVKKALISSYPSRFINSMVRYKKVNANTSRYNVSSYREATELILNASAKELNDKPQSYVDAVKAIANIFVDYDFDSLDLSTTAKFLKSVSELEKLENDRRTVLMDHFVNQLKLTNDPELIDARRFMFNFCLDPALMDDEQVKVARHLLGEMVQMKTDLVTMPSDALSDETDRKVIQNKDGGFEVINQPMNFQAMNNLAEFNFDGLDAAFAGADDFDKDKA